ncbi:MAG: UDP-N-acetylmuramate--L-alanine ligase, partial [Acidimicrobiia bacterium]
SAVPADDPELAAAATGGIEVWRRPRLLHALTRLLPTVGVTGTHGKTSSTALMVAALQAVGRDPSFVVGGELTDLRTNAHLGDPDLLVLEADEAFGTFEQLRLGGLMVTNVEPEHLDHFLTIEELEESFVRVVGNVEGPVVVGGDDPGARRVAERAGRPTYGTTGGCEWRLTDIEEGAASVRFRLTGPGVDVPVEVGRPGIHMARNAAGVLALLSALGIDPRAAAAGLAGYRGVRRRFEMRGSVGGVTIIDDYAHHPTEVAATIQAARRGGWLRVWAVFQPHLYSRTELLHEAFGPALALADLVVVTDVYGAREAPRPGITGRLVADAADRAGAPVSYVPHRSDVALHLAERVAPGDLVLTVGAGDITLVPDELALLLAQLPAAGDPAGDR